MNRTGGNGTKSPQLASSPLYGEHFEKLPKHEEKHEDNAQQGVNALHSPTRLIGTGEKGFTSPTKPAEDNEMMISSHVPGPRDQHTQLHVPPNSKIPSDSTEPERTIEDATMASDTNNQRRPSVTEQEQSANAPGAATAMTGASSATIPPSSSFSAFPPPPPPPPASAPLAATSDMNSESDQQIPQQMTTRAHRAASVSSKSGTSTQPIASEIASLPRARNTRNNGQRPATSSRNSSISAFNDTVADKNSDHAAAAAAAAVAAVAASTSATGSGQPRRSYKKGSGTGNGGTSSGRTSRRGSASSHQHQHHSLSTTEALVSAANPRSATGHLAMSVPDGANEHGGRRGSTTGYGDDRGNFGSGSGSGSGGNGNGNGNGGASRSSDYNIDGGGSNKSTMHGPSKSRRDADHARDNKNSSNNGTSSSSSRRASAQAVPGVVGVVARAGAGVGGEPANEDEEEDDDADEPRYCYCNQVSYGEMVACDNPDCLREWFHLACVGLSRPPSSKCKMKVPIYSFFFLSFFLSCLSPSFFRNYIL